MRIIHNFWPQWVSAVALALVFAEKNVAADAIVLDDFNRPYGTNMGLVGLGNPETSRVWTIERPSVHGCGPFSRVRPPPQETVEVPLGKRAA